MQEWWIALSGSSKFFYGMAVFFSVFFLWQIIAVFMGLGGDEADFDGDVDGDIDFDGDLDVDAPDDIDMDDMIDSSQAFRMLSLRSIITFFTLFSWGSALYTSEGMNVVMAMGISCVWGLVGMVLIALIFYGMAKLAETGTKDVMSCKGKVGTVYLNIPAGGVGEIKVMITGASTHVKAESVDEEMLPAGTQVRVVQVVSQTLVKVKKI